MRGLPVSVGLIPIVISEAIRLSERFSSAESPRFINGVLAGISKTGRPA